MGIIDGNRISREIQEGITKEIRELKEKGITPGLATILVGENPASKLYINLKEKACKNSGIYSEKYQLLGDADESELIKLIERLNHQDNIHGILVQFPLPEHMNPERIMAGISPEKDVDGFNPVNIGSLALGNEKLVPCTPKGIIRMLEHENIDLEGKNVVIVNHSPVVGKPLAMMLLKRNATVEVCHIKTMALEEHTRKADILVTATGVPNLIMEDMITEGAVVIDAGISKTGKGIQGDVDFEAVRKKASLITPVPGGVGPMTIAMLLENTLIATKLQVEK